MRKTVFLLLHLMIACNLAVLDAQVRVALRLDESRKPVWGFAQLCDKKNNCGLAAGELSKMSRGHEGLLVKVTRVGKDFYLTVDTNQDGDLAGERKTFLRNSGTVRIVIRKQIAARRYALLPFEIEHEAPEEKGDTTDQFFLRPAYVASGTLTYKKCASSVSVFDMNLDGRFTSADSDRGTNLQIDKNNDGKFWGKEENIHTAEIVGFCGQNFLVTSLSNRSLVLMPTDLRLAKVGESVPDFSIALLTGQVISANGLKGKHYVLDFWASWCVPCVRSLPQIELIKEEFDPISVFSVNVDKPARRGIAWKIVQDIGIHEFTAIRGLGNNDPVWKIFGGASSNRLVIPLYVLIDKDSVVRYAGNGGENLIALKREIEKLVSNSRFVGMNVGTVGAL
ncbi:MAG: TlpA disulfide reductase family protein [Pyrinomonadaceae bacterium]